MKKQDDKNTIIDKVILKVYGNDIPKKNLPIIKKALNQLNGESISKKVMCVLQIKKALENDSNKEVVAKYMEIMDILNQDASKEGMKKAKHVLDEMGNDSEAEEKKSKVTKLVTKYHSKGTDFYKESEPEKAKNPNCKKSLEKIDKQREQEQKENEEINKQIFANQRNNQTYKYSFVDVLSMFIVAKAVLGKSGIGGGSLLLSCAISELAQGNVQQENYYKNVSMGLEQSKNNAPVMEYKFNNNSIN